MLLQGYGQPGQHAIPCEALFKVQVGYGQGPWVAEPQDLASLSHERGLWLHRDALSSLARLS